MQSFLPKINQFSRIMLVYSLVLILAISSNLSGPNQITRSINLKSGEDIALKTHISEGQSLLVEISNVVGDFTLIISYQDKSKGIELKFRISEDKTISLPFESSREISLYIISTIDALASLKISLTGMGTGVYLSLIMTIIFIMISLISEIAYQKSIFSSYIKDEINSINSLAILGAMLMYSLFFNHGYSEAYFSKSISSQELEYSTMVHAYTAYSDFFINFRLILLAFLVMLSVNRRKDTDGVAIYSTLPIDPLKQYVSRTLVHLAIITFMVLNVSVISIMEAREFAGITNNITIYSIVLILLLLTSYLFIYTQILVTDLIKERYAGLLLLPILGFIYILFPFFNIPILNYLVPVLDTESFPVPDVPVFLLEVVLISTLMIILNVLLRRSKYFKPN